MEFPLRLLNLDAMCMFKNKGLIMEQDTKFFFGSLLMFDEVSIDKWNEGFDEILLMRFVSIKIYSICWSRFNLEGCVHMYIYRYTEKWKE